MENRRIAVIADVHANMYALQAFLDYLADNPEIEQVWNLGDFLQIGPHPAEVADLILQDNRFITIIGNNEQALLHRDTARFSEGEVAHQNWTIMQLGEERMERIRALPVAIRNTVGGKQVLLTHEKPAASEVIDNASLVCFGHTHLPSWEMHWNVLLLNPGALGFAQGHTSACFGLLDVNGASVSMQYHAIPYDRAALKDDFVQRQVPDREHIFSIYLQGE